MAWGYEASFTIEHDNTLKRKISCKDCLYYDSSDKSCTKRPLYLPEDGYNSWRNCDFFDLEEGVSHYGEKKAQYLRFKNSRSIKKSESARIRTKTITTPKPTNISKSKIAGDVPNETFNRGDAIKHKVFGYGVVTDIGNPRGKITIWFTPENPDEKQFEKNLDLKTCINNRLITKVKTIKYEEPLGKQVDDKHVVPVGEVSSPVQTQPKVSTYEADNLSERQENTSKEEASAFKHVISGLKGAINRIKQLFIR